MSSVRPDGRRGRVRAAVGVGPPVVRVVAARAWRLRQGDARPLLRVRQQVCGRRRRRQPRHVAAAPARALARTRAPGARATAGLA